jgi:hypothetical protein
MDLKEFALDTAQMAQLKYRTEVSFIGTGVAGVIAAVTRAVWFIKDTA